MHFVTRETEADLTARYNEPHRYYHNMTHILHSLAALERLRSVMTKHELRKSEVFLIGLMIWFHDAIYEQNVVHGENERLSEQLFSRSVEASLLEPHESVIVKNGILYSAQHTKHYSYYKKTQEIFLDIDLCGMGESYETFMVNGKNIQHEYPWVDYDAFMAGRTRFFQELLKRPYLYYNHVMRGMYEENTRNNINRWLRENSNV